MPNLIAVPLVPDFIEGEIVLCPNEAKGEWLAGIVETVHADKEQVAVRFGTRLTLWTSLMLIRTGLKEVHV